MLRFLSEHSASVSFRVNIASRLILPILPVTPQLNVCYILSQDYTSVYMSLSFSNFCII